MTKYPNKLFSEQVKPYNRHLHILLTKIGTKYNNNSRYGRSGGGVCLYISSALQVNVRDDIAIADRHSDSLFIEINIKDGKNLYVGVIYRPPDADLDTFNIKLEGTLFSINEKNKNCILLRDVNIDLS